jgi:hypothetical protein
VIKKVALATTGWQVFSLGDTALTVATSQHLAKRGVAVFETPGPLARAHQTVIGGGHIISPQLGAKEGMFNSFRLPGRHLLNTVGIRLHEMQHQNATWSYLKDYSYISVRDQESAIYLKNQGVLQKIHVAPCAASLLRPMSFELLTRLPGFEWLLDEKDYVIVHPVDNIPKMKKLPVDCLAIETQPWLQRDNSTRWRSLPLTQSPFLVCSAISRARAVVTRSLHLAIFALSNGVPFCCIDNGKDPQSQKLRWYFHRAGIPEVMCDDQNPMEHIRQNVSRKKIEKVALREKEKCEEHFDRMVRFIE